MRKPQTAPGAWRAVAKAAPWTLVLVATGLGAGSFARYPLGQGSLVAGLAFALAVGLVAFPLAATEGALGRMRRRNVADAFTGPWRAAGWLAAVAALALTAVLAIVAAWAARYVLASYFGGFYDEPSRFWRLAEQGWDVLALAFGAMVIAAATAVSRRTWTLLAITASLALVACAAFVLYALLATGAGGRDAAFALDARDLQGSTIPGVLLQALLPGLVGFGAILALCAREAPQDLPRSATGAAIAWAAVPVLMVAALTALAHEHGVDVQAQRLPFDFAPTLFAQVGGTLGGVLSGTFYGILLAGCLSAMTVLLHVPGSLVQARVGAEWGWTTSHGVLAAAAIAYLVAVPMAFVGGLAANVDAALRGIVAPLGGLLLALHVGWARPDALAGLIVGDAEHDLGRTLRPFARYVLPAVLAFLLVLGTMHALSTWGAGGSGGLWRLVP